MKYEVKLDTLLNAQTHTLTHSGPTGTEPNLRSVYMQCPSGVKVSSTPEVPPQLEACYTGSITRQTNHLTLT